MEITTNGSGTVLRYNFRSDFYPDKFDKPFNLQSGNQKRIPFFARIISLKPSSVFILPILLFFLISATGFLHAQVNAGKPQISVLPGSTPFIQLVSPAPDKPCKNVRPTFAWQPGSSIQGVSYTVTLRELKNDVGFDKGNLIFEKKGIKETVLKFPSDIKQLDSSKVYLCTVSAFDNNNNLISQSLPTPLVVSDLLSFCFSGAMPIQSNLCLGSSPQILFLFVQFPGSGPTHWTLSNGQSGNISSWIGIVTVTPAPTNAGTFDYTLTLSRGGCTKTQTVSFLVYPVLHAQILDYPALTPITAICIGDDAQLNLQGLSAGFTVNWDWSDVSATGPWTTLGSGNPMNTNIIDPSPCTCPSKTRWFRATASKDGFPPPGLAGCPLQQTVSLTIWCQTVAGTITVAGGNSICASSYPVHVNLTLNGNCGVVQSWTRSPGTITPTPPSGATSITDVITAAGNYTYTVTVRNGICNSSTVSTVIRVEDPITSPITCTPTEVCPNDDAVLTVSPTGGTPPYNIQWQYQINCTGPWTYSGVTGTTQNTNPIGNLGPYTPPPTSSLCWRAIISSSTGICAPYTTSTATISIIQPPCPPTITISSGSLPKCPGTPITLHATTACGTGPFTWQWYLNGEILTGETNPDITATLPGTYSIVVYNKHNCDNATTVFEVTDCIIDLSISGPCTSNGTTAITLIAHAISNCGGPFMYHWSTGASTPSITVTPGTTTTYCVTVTDGHGCTKNQCITIKICP